MQAMFVNSILYMYKYRIHIQLHLLIPIYRYIIYICNIYYITLCIFSFYRKCLTCWFVDSFSGPVSNFSLNLKINNKKCLRKKEKRRIKYSGCGRYNDRHRSNKRYK